MTIKQISQLRPGRLSALTSMTANPSQPHPSMKEWKNEVCPLEGGQRKAPVFPYSADHLFIHNYLIIHPYLLRKENSQMVRCQQHPLWYELIPL
jgi:hypothetical protein